MKWNLKQKAPKKFVEKFPEYSNLVKQLLYDRELDSQEKINKFLNPDYEQDFNDPFLLKDMKKAVKRILAAIKKQEKILIYGDYDADGVCSSAILFLTLKHLKVKNLSIYIPDRDKQGHGLNKQAIQEIAKNKINLIITVDCGSRDIEEVKLAKSLGVDVIITDHHEVGEKLPKAFAVIDFNRKDDKYPFKHLAGAGVAYKLACALLGKDDSFKKWLLDLAAIATVADVMPIIGENRTLVLYGLGVLAQTRWLGLQELLKIAKVESSVELSCNGKPPSTNLNSFTLGFVLGPRLNAASRMDHANSAFQLLISQNRKQAYNLAENLNKKNIDRQKLTDKIASEIRSRLDKLFIKNKKPNIIFEGSSDWSVGLVGLAATKVAEKYFRPCFIYHKKKDIIQVSSRSIPDFDLMEAIEKCSDYLERYGGHKGSAGFVAKKENLNKIKIILTKFANKKLKNKILEKKLEVDAELFLEDINWTNYDKIQKFAPFGRGNLEPKFLIKNAQITNLQLVGKSSNHLKLNLKIFDKDKNLAKDFKAIGFCLGHWSEKLKPGDTINLVFELIANEWNGYRDLQMKIIDLKLSIGSF